MMTLHTNQIMIGSWKKVTGNEHAVVRGTNVGTNVGVNEKKKKLLKKLYELREK